MTPGLPNHSLNMLHLHTNSHRQTLNVRIERFSQYQGSNPARNPIAHSTPGPQGNNYLTTTSRTRSFQVNPTQHFHTKLPNRQLRQHRTTNVPDTTRIAEPETRIRVNPIRDLAQPRHGDAVYQQPMEQEIDQDSSSTGCNCAGMRYTSMVFPCPKALGLVILDAAT